MAAVPAAFTGSQIYGKRALAIPSNLSKACARLGWRKKNELAQNNVRELDSIFDLCRWLLDLETAWSADIAQLPATPIVQVEGLDGSSGLPPYCGCRVLRRCG